MKMNERQKRLAVSGVVALVAFPLTLAAFFQGVVPRPVLRVSWDRPPNASTYTPSASDSTGDEIVLVWVSSPTCGWCNDPDLPALVETAKMNLRAAAMRSGHAFAAIGIAQSRSVDDGLSHLRRFGQFDEVSSGRGWLNGSLQKFVYSEHLGPAATPQLIVLRRSIEVDVGGRRIRDERVLARKIGIAGIDRWVTAGSNVALDRRSDGVADDSIHPQLP